ncbi:DUF4037 domain-containing protein [Micromonospora peucetia]|uniref:DUF4037 domain-containing protein n=1 Tax=Micromonospora peucetia TaxID=47871 RepID=A0A1C6W2F5_9ACTN|nr:DUF4037 domain-containing protein [Micromonospora peucetia]WSA32070.1 DUF4037 domain-containing protein [Micromonospora peucetia]SCL72692.1 protein of unknown function (DUF4037) [Micromonospora peucetia]
MTFVAGLTLARRFHDEALAPILRRRLPGLRYAAGLLDGGSELLGLDTSRSTDHDWGPRGQLFVAASDAAWIPHLRAVLDADLPAEFLGWPARFTGEGRLGVADRAGSRHGVTIHELGGWWRDRLGFDPAAGVSTADWLATPTQRLAEVTGGEVFHDGLGGALSGARATLAWYPDDVWRHVLAAAWTRVAQAEHLPGRCAETGDDLGSRVVTAGLARDLMRLGLLLHRHWPPYDKWLGTLFARLPGAAPLVASLADALGPGDWPSREDGLVRALEALAAWTDDTRLAAPVRARPRPFHRRPFLVLDAGRIASALCAAITDPALRERPPVGAVDQYVGSVDVLTHARRVRRVAAALPVAADGSN